MQLPRDAKFWSRKYRRQRLAEMATCYSVGQVAALFGCSVGYVQRVCAELGVSPRGKTVIELPSVHTVVESKQPKKSNRKTVDANVRTQKWHIERRWATAERFCLACGEELCEWQQQAGVQTGDAIYSYCAECGAELRYGKIRLPEELSSNWLVRVPGGPYRNNLGRWYPLDDVDPWYENARRAYEGD